MFCCRVCRKHGDRCAHPVIRLGKAGDDNTCARFDIIMDTIDIVIGYPDQTCELVQRWRREFVDVVLQVLRAVCNIPPGVDFVRV